MHIERFAAGRRPGAAHVCRQQRAVRRRAPLDPATSNLGQPEAPCRDSVHSLWLEMRRSMILKYEPQLTCRPAYRLCIGGSLIGSIKETQEMLDLCGEKNITCEVEVRLLRFDCCI